MKYLSIAVFALLVLCSYFANAQLKRGRSKPGTGSTDASQWWIGVRGGTNFSAAMPEASYSVFSYISEASGDFDQKIYSRFNLPGLEFGFSISYEFIRGLSVNLYPSYVSYRFEYSNSFGWYDIENSAKQVNTDYQFQTRLQYVEVPLMVKYELLQGKFKPYLQAGGYYGFLTDALKNVKITAVDQASGGDSEINVTELSVGTEERTEKMNYGVAMGVGFTQNVGNARLGLEVNYHHGLENLDNGALKYSDNQLLTGTYDVPDDYAMQNINVVLQIIIPLKFITSKDYVPL